jgi:hypothetical protein
MRKLFTIHYAELSYAVRMLLTYLLVACYDLDLSLASYRPAAHLSISHLRIPRWEEFDSSRPEIDDFIKYKT